MIGILSGVTRLSLGRYGGISLIGPDEMEQRLAERHAELVGRLVALTRFLAQGTEGQEVHVTVETPLIARVLPATEKPVRWLENGVCEHVFPIEAVAPHPALIDEVPRYGFGIAIDRFGGFIGRTPRRAPWHLRMRRSLA